MRIYVFATVMATLCVLVSAPAIAGHVSVDFGPIFGSGGDGDDFGTASVNDGSGACVATFTLPESCPLTLVNNASSGALDLGFPIDFGTGAVTSLYVNENGIVSFTGPVTSTSFASLASVGLPVIAPYFADLNSVAFVDSVFDMVNVPGQLMYQRGSATALPDSTGAFNQTDEVPAFAVTWDGPTNAGGVQVFTQLIIYSHASSASGDFDIRFRYGLADTDAYNTGTAPSGIAGLLLGSNSLTVTGPLAAATDYFYSFRGGKLVGSVTPPPPLTLACPTATAQVGSAYSSAFTAAGGVTPYTFSSTGSLPTGLTLNSSSGTLTGTPSASGSFTFTAQVVDSSGSAAGTVTSSCTIAVSPATLKLSVNPTAVAFGTVKQFSLHYKTVTLTNTGTGPISLSRASVTPGAGTTRDDFIPISLCGSSLAAGKSCPIFVVLFARSAGSLSATLNIPNNAAGSVNSVPLSATVTPTKH